MDAELGQIPIVTTQPLYVRPQVYQPYAARTTTYTGTKDPVNFETTEDGTQRMFLVFLLAIILVVIIVVILMYLISGNRDSPSGTAPLIDLPFGAACDINHHCANGLTCETTCKKNLGQECDSLAECVSTATTCTIDGSGNNVCKTGPIGGLDENCPCDSGYLCNDDGRCKIEIGLPCSIDDDCISDQCVNGICGHGAAEGESCNLTSDCDLELHCSVGICQQDGVDTGEEGAYCNNGDECGDGLTCVTNTCAITTQGLGDSCGSTLFCSTQLVCDISQGNGSCNTGVCIYPPNNCCSCEIQCPDGMRCVCGKCLGEKNAPCALSSSCVSGSCNTSEPGLFTWSGQGWNLFSILPEIALKIDVIPGDGATTLDTIWMVGATGLWWYDRYNVSGPTWVLAYENTINWETTGRVYILSLSTYGDNVMVSGYIAAADLTVYIGLFTTTLQLDGTVTLTAFNTTVALREGEQYDAGSYALPITSFSVNSDEDVVIVAPDETTPTNSTVFIKSSADTLYTNQSLIIHGSISQYIPLAEGNYAVVNADSTKVAYKGSLSGLLWPTDSDHTVIDQDIDDTSTNGLIMVLQSIINNEYNVYTVTNNTQLRYPGRFGPQSRVAASDSEWYVSSSGVCH